MRERCTRVKRQKGRERMKQLRNVVFHSLYHLKIPAMSERGLADSFSKRR